MMIEDFTAGVFPSNSACFIAVKYALGLSDADEHLTAQYDTCKSGQSTLTPMS